MSRIVMMYKLAGFPNLVSAVKNWIRGGSALDKSRIIDTTKLFGPPGPQLRSRVDELLRKMALPYETTIARKPYIPGKLPTVRLP